mmetsp:Transcript_13696/g.34933  ORF Transcript_13696/g.34933 Transcript_13696/m.34933 type:complete len:95 (-) Transcript_13696:149-433(-)
MDFTVVNTLASLNHQGQALPPALVEQTTDSHFATFEQDEVESGEMLEEFPMECQGLTDKSRRFVLKSLLEALKNKSGDASGGGNRRPLKWPWQR